MMSVKNDGREKVMNFKFLVPHFTPGDSETWITVRLEIQEGPQQTLRRKSNNLILKPADMK